MVSDTPSDKLYTPIRMAEVLAALSLATDLGAGKPMGHAIRACILGMRMARELKLSTTDQAELYYSYLLMHSGCTVLSLGLSPAIQGDELAAIGDITLRDDTDPLVMLDWMRRYVSPDAPPPVRARNVISMMLHSSDANEHTRGTCEVAVRVAQRLGMPPGVLVMHYHEIAGMGSEDIEKFRSSSVWQERVAAAHTLPRELRADERYRFDAPRFKNLHHPTLLLTGSDSRAFEKKGIEMLAAALPNSLVAVMQGQEHVAMYTAPELFLNEVVSFFLQNR